MSYTITIIGAVGGISPYNDDDIIRLLNTQQTALSHGETFTGRPDTKVYIDINSVLKIRSEIRLDALSAIRWAKQALEKEIRYQVHHPDKTWFVAEYSHQEKSTVVIGNICPRLAPLHEIVVDQKVNPEDFLHYFTRLFHHYFRLAKTLQIRLDEGLSNFGMTTDRQLYYLDDDIYSWDRFISCAQMLGVYFRSLTWLTPSLAKQLGYAIRQQIIEHFADVQYLIVLEEQMKDVFMPAQHQQKLIQEFIAGLNEGNKKPQVPPIHLHHNRYLAILADIHANLPALQAVLAFLDSNNIKQGIMAGDIVGYGPHPSECIELIQKTDFLVLKGNHDHGLATNNFQKGFSSTASWVLTWTQQHTNSEHIQWLVDLPPLAHEDNWLALHGAPIDPTFFNAYVYEMTYQDNLDVLARKKIPICFHGHTHQPGMYARKGRTDKYYLEDEIALQQFDHSLICPGSIGQPRNGKSGAQFAIYDQKEHKVTFHTIQYNLELIEKKMREEEFPTTLINVLHGNRN